MPASRANLSPPRRPLPACFFARETVTVARGLVGCTLWAEADGTTCAGRIVEAEAYLDARDPASHAARGPTPRSAIMYGPPGVAYVYLIYGMYHCLNAVTEAEGRAGAVLLRALEPLVGLPAMQDRRGGAPARDLCRGPGRLCQALGIDRDWNGLPLVGRRQPTANKPGTRRVWIAAGRPPRTLTAGSRIGIRRAADRPFRFCDPESDCLSRPPDPGRF
jgi:DNA-3-methyladenine glycosylase